MKFHRFFIVIVALAFLTDNLSAQNDSPSKEKIPSRGYAVMEPGWKFIPHDFERRAVGDEDVLIEILYSGICHTDLHQAASDWFQNVYPMIPGHEIVGRVKQVGKKVRNFEVGDYAGVGCMVDNTCNTCTTCKEHEEQYCQKTIFTYGSKDVDGTVTMGGYANNIVVTERFVVKIPPNAPLEKTAPLLCAGITTYSPLRYNKVKQGDKVGVAGFGGLGLMAVQYAVAMGADVTIFDPVESKRETAEKMGAVKFVNVRNAEEFEGLQDTFYIILSTIPVAYDVAQYLNMLQKGGSLVILGIPSNKDAPSISINQLSKRRKIYGSLIGGVKETQEMLDYSVKHNIYPEVEVIPIQKLDEAFQNLAEGKAPFRYVIDMRTLDFLEEKKP